MMHPDAELRYINDSMGYGLFARKRIPRGTITWTGDELDQHFSEKQLAEMSDTCREQVEKYAYVNSCGTHILCWDHGRFVNHSCNPNCLSSGFDFEFAIRDIEPGEQICDDYGLLNLTENMACDCGSANCRGSIGPQDMDKNADRWDSLVGSAFPSIHRVEQPLWHVLADRAEIAAVLSGKASLPSCRAHSFEKLTSR